MNQRELEDRGETTEQLLKQRVRELEQQLAAEKARADFLERQNKNLLTEQAHEEQVRNDLKTQLAASQLSRAHTDDALEAVERASGFVEANTTISLAQFVSNLRQLAREGQARADKAEVDLKDAEECLRLELHENLELFDLLGLRSAQDFGTDRSTAALKKRIIALIDCCRRALLDCLSVLEQDGKHPITLRRTKEALALLGRNEPK